MSYSYDAWGQTVNKTGTLYNPYTYRGYYQDDEVGVNKVDPDGNYAAAAFLYFIPGLGEVAMAATIIGAGIYTGYELAHYFAKKKEGFVSKKDKRKGAEKRQKTGARERNTGHPNAEEHSRKAKGTGGRGARR